LGFIFVFATQNGEEHFTRRPHERKRARATRDLKYREHGNDRSKSHCGKAEKAEHRHEQQRHSHAEEFHQPSGEENLEQERERVNRQIELSEKRSARSAIGETGLGQFGLLKIRPGRCERVEQNKEKQAEQVGRAADVSNAFANAAANRYVGSRVLIMLATP